MNRYTELTGFVHSIWSMLSLLCVNWLENRWKQILIQRNIVVRILFDAKSMHLGIRSHETHCVKAKTFISSRFYWEWIGIDGMVPYNDNNIYFRDFRFYRRYLFKQFIIVNWRMSTTLAVSSKVRNKSSLLSDYSVNKTRLID